ncbi:MULTISPECIES: ParB N-terminal domain-containing protein [unclassified Anaerotruncus]|uniref:ParB/RepB/Spo0J family partition protein n=1 Tax=Anaerotruncus sp. 1XD42-93 TaxID=2320853 RepID=UPI000EA2149C|nr:hypothetical protein [Anaerotruncus sp. 1XD42-93]RKJ79796.1 hypothetical protein D7Y41_27615 [Anaerotruncus sp. 1XD22-93]
MAFDIMSLNRNRSAIQAKSRADEQSGRAVLKYIDVDDLVPSTENFYSMSAIEELAFLIALSGGIKQPGLAVPLGGGKYRLIAGHRRRLASVLLVERGKQEYKKMPCIVETVHGEEPKDVAGIAEEEALREIDEAILLIATNGYREKTDWERVQEVMRLRALLERKRQFQKIPGQTRKIIAEQLGTTPAQVGRYESIDKHLLPDFKEAMKAERMGISVAYELSTLPEQIQKAALAEYKAKGSLSIEDVKRRRQEEEEKQPMPGQITLEELEEERQDMQPPQRQSPPTFMKASGTEEKTPCDIAGKIVDAPTPPSAMEPPEKRVKPNSEQPASVPSPQPAQIPAAEKADGTSEMEEVLERLNDLVSYCMDKEEKGDRSRDWVQDVRALLFAIDYLDSCG